MNLVYTTELRAYEKKLKEYLGLEKSNTCDYSYKAKLLNDNLPSLVNSVSRIEKEFIKRDLVVDTLSRDTLSEMFGFCAMLESYRLQDSYKHRVARLRCKILDILTNDSNTFFLTFTFRDSTLKTTSEKSRRDYVRKWLKSNTLDYVANIDYGEKNHREHYHALVSCDRVDTSKWFDLCGAMNFEQVHITENCDKKLALYINKFMYHAIKETTKRQHILYSRKKSLTSHN